VHLFWLGLLLHRWHTPHICARFTSLVSTGRADLGRSFSHLAQVGGVQYSGGGVGSASTKASATPKPVRYVPFDSGASSRMVPSTLVGAASLVLLAVFSTAGAGLLGAAFP
jgi:hypothetical protein